MRTAVSQPGRAWLARGFALVAAFVVGGWACDRQGSTEWTITFANGDLQARASRVIARIREGDCAESVDVRGGGAAEYYRAVLRADAPTTRPPVLARGRYAFEVIAVDGACVAFADDCVAEVLDQRSHHVTNTVRESAEQELCPDGTCESGECTVPTDAGPDGPEGGSACACEAGVCTGATQWAWTRLSVDGSAPLPMLRPATIHDPNNQRMVVIGGYDHAYGFEAFTLLLPTDGTSGWRTLSATGTPGRWFRPSAIFDSANREMIVFGGADGFSCPCTNDTHAFSLPIGEAPEWRAVSTTGTPPSPRTAHTAVYDAANERMIVFGGKAESGGNETFALELPPGGGQGAWTELVTTGTPPTARWEHAAIYDVANARMIVFGGANSAGNETFSLSFERSGTPAWRVLRTTGEAPSARFAPSAVYDPANRRMIVFGGTVGGPDPYLSDVFVLSLPPQGTATEGQWSAIVPAGDGPPASEEHFAVFDSVNHQMVVVAPNAEQGGAFALRERCP